MSLLYSIGKLLGYPGTKTYSAYDAIIQAGRYELEEAWYPIKPSVENPHTIRVVYTLKERSILGNMKVIRKLSFDLEKAENRPDNNHLRAWVKLVTGSDEYAQALVHSKS